MRLASQVFVASNAYWIKFAQTLDTFAEARPSRAARRLFCALPSSHR
jgi:hypothetical protein